YSLMLAQNVFHIAVDRTIPLYRAATAVNFVFTIFTLILLSSIIFALNLPLIWIMVLIFILHFPLYLQSLWTARIEPVNGQLVIYTLIVTVLITETSLALIFWPVSAFIRALFLSTISYVLLGIMIDYLQEKIQRRTIME